MPDLWGTPKAVIVKAAIRKYSDAVAVSVQPLSTGLWAYVDYRRNDGALVHDAPVYGRDIIHEDWTHAS